MFIEDFNQYYQYFDMLVNYCNEMYYKLYHVDCIEDAKDIVQDCYLKAYFNFQKGDFLKYMKILIKNQFLNENKARILPPKRIGDE